ncbi:unnamed protein product [Camellia sinensis]
MFGVVKIRSPLEGKGGDGDRFPIRDRCRGREDFHHRESGMESVIPALPQPVAIPNRSAPIM